jgi:hypothetical protein
MLLGESKSPKDLCIVNSCLCQSTTHRAYAEI